MNELYEIAKTVDVMVMFAIIYIIACASLGAGVAHVIHWFMEKWDALWDKFKAPKDTK